ncbi:hypothetical protein Poli38472_008383 [Pythium oligandrum]|uniref:C2 Aida-type domain-containing protein n=1 Tax=Pythium oligandrum TaxID=41045 RepID=A0A8K1CN94_PYTOL|nr:hypothetical protein Poli38472_008383 [Pythium oligandrum]|eukprot:TMW65741.1 hypothetical protein Poli38472_008383 [Pythium oligandrum]
MEELKTRHSTWTQRLQDAVQADGWGQVLEAVEAYEELATELTAALKEQRANLSSEQQTALRRTARALEDRARGLSSVEGDQDAPTADDMQTTLQAFRSLFAEPSSVHPLPTPAANKADGNEELEDVEESKRPLHRPPDASYLDIQIVKVGLKDAVAYVNPTIVVSVHDKDGKSMEEAKETSVGKSDGAQHIAFGKNDVIQLETSLERMQERGGAVFFEFYHYKAKKRKKSCRCWALLELDELRNASTLALELYQKPMDPKRKRINLFTVKDLFLHVQLTTQNL